MAKFESFCSHIIDLEAVLEVHCYKQSDEFKIAVVFRNHHQVVLTFEKEDDFRSCQNRLEFHLRNIK